MVFFNDQFAVGINQFQLILGGEYVFFSCILVEIGQAQDSH